VNIASRVQHLATTREIFATGSVLEDPRASEFLAQRGLTRMSHNVMLRGITDQISIFTIP
jgi:class 3 adenylate cyclase